MHPNDSLEPSGGTTRAQRRRSSKRFPCDLCQKHFGRLEHLQRHERTHTQERPFACDVCPSRFTRRLNNPHADQTQANQHQSDLLIRHGRLSHSKDSGKGRQSNADEAMVDSGVPSSPQRATQPSGSGDMNFQQSHQHTEQNLVPAMNGNHLHRSPLDVLSTYATSFHDALGNGTAQNTAPSNGIPVETMSYEEAQPAHMPAPASSVVDPGLLPEPDQADLDWYTFNNFANFLERPLPSFNMSSLFTTEQPLPFFSPQDYNELQDEPAQENQQNQEQDHDHTIQGPQDPESFSRFGSRLPSLQPEEAQLDRHDREHLSPSHHYQISHRPRPYAKRVSDVSNEDRQTLVDSIAKFDTVSSSFRLPTRLTLARYVRAYVDGFHEHLPFLHIPTMTITNCAVELILAMAAVGAQYCFEAEEGIGLFHAARAIATERIRRRDARIAAAERGAEQSPSEYAASTPSARCRSDSNSHYTFNGPLGLPTDREPSAITASSKEDLMQSAQALLVLMAMATWAKHKEILREALAIQSILASIVRDDGLRLPPNHEPPTTWHEWARFESTQRTKFISFAFYNLHCIVYDIPPLILNSELNMRLPCGAGMFKAPSEALWKEESRRCTDQPMQFQDALRRLFSGSNDETSGKHSALGNYILIHAIIQHIFFVRQSARCRFDSPELTADEVTPLDQAVRNWQAGWKHSPESSLNPLDPNGPVAFNSTALLRLAYIRLNMDTGPGRALGTRDPLQIAHAMKNTPVIKRGPKLSRALLHSAHALSIPIKIGIRLVAKTQTFVWSIQHSLCSLECALLLGKWLEAISALGPDPNPPVSDSEMRILSLVRTVLDETEFRVPSHEQPELPQLAKHLNVGVLRVWAEIFKGAQTWAIVEVIGNSLEIYAEMLEAT